MTEKLKTRPVIYQEIPQQEMIARSADFYQQMSSRRSVREFADRSVPMPAIFDAIAAAGTAPSGANKQPWHFAVTTDSQVKATLRDAAEQEEREFYQRRATEEWLDALKPLGTDANKPFLEIAPVLIGVFMQKSTIDTDGRRSKNYYPMESAGIACGLLIASLHLAGLATLTHTPSPMGFMNQIFERPANEKPYLLLVVGYPAENCRLPDIARKSMAQICSTVGSPL